MQSLRNHLKYKGYLNCTRTVFVILGVLIVLATILHWIASLGWAFTKEWQIIRRNQNLVKLIRNFPNEDDADFSKHSLNVHLSHNTPMDRDIPDTRPEECLNIEYNVKEMSKVSVLMPFYDESWSMLLRAIHSIVDKTPEHLLHEIILIDDSSSYDYLGTPLEKYCAALSPLIKIIRSPAREGLMRARMRGANASTGEVIVFLDAHVECNAGWLEPLLHIIKKRPNVIAVPTIDEIDAESINYRKWSMLAYGGFTWSMEYLWKVLPDDLVQKLSPTQPFPTATTIGCAMAMSRAYFYHIGGFDEGMYIWGGENLEISFRTWMCGGSLLILPCSRVGHVFRGILPYVFPNMYGGGDVRQKNYQRVAEVWMDDYKHLYYAATGFKLNMTKEEQSSLDTRIALRQKLQCKSFSWYLQNVVLDMPIPDPTAVFFGQIKSYGTQTCVSVNDSSIIASFCGKQTADQYFSFTSNKHIVSFNGSKCLTAHTHSSSVYVKDCDPLLDNQMWTFDTSAGVDKRYSYVGTACIFPKGPGIGSLMCLSLNEDYTLTLEESSVSPQSSIFWEVTDKITYM